MPATMPGESPLVRTMDGSSDEDCDAVVRAAVVEGAVVRGAVVGGAGEGGRQLQLYKSTASDHPPAVPA